MLLCAVTAVNSVSAEFKAASYRTPAWIGFEKPKIICQEGELHAVINVVRTGEFREMSSISYATSEGTAKAGEDFKPSGGTLVFAPGEGFKTLKIPLLQTAEEEQSESFLLELTEPGPNVQLVASEAVVEITEAGSAPRLNITAASSSIRLSWPATETGWVLERSDTPLANAWHAVPTAPQRVEDQWVVDEMISQPNFFYRLRKN